MTDSAQKRKAGPDAANGKAKKQKNWRTPKQVNWSKAGTEIHIGDTGIWVTSHRGREGKCAAEVLDLFDEYAQKLYGDIVHDGNDEDDEDEPSDIEKAISSELSDIKKAKSTSLFKVIRPEIACVLFIKTKPPVDPVSLVHSICEDIASGASPRRYRNILRLTPATSTEKAQERNFEELARKILKPTFHDEGSGSQKFAIRYTSRNNSILKREDVIKKTAAIVGEGHKVDLDDPETVILVDIYKNICTMAVVDGDYNSLKRYNLAELGDDSETRGNSNTSRLKKSEDQETPIEPKSEVDTSQTHADTSDGKASNGS